MTQSRNTGGVAFGRARIWMCANLPPYGIFETDLDSNLLSHRQIPLGPPDNGGGCHGAKYHDGKLWIASLRLRRVLSVDPDTWQPEFMIPAPPGRSHDIAFDGKGSVWIVTGNESTRYADGVFGIDRYDVASGDLHPNWPKNDSPTSGTIFRIDIL